MTSYFGLATQRAGRVCAKLDRYRPDAVHVFCWTLDAEHNYTFFTGLRTTRNMYVMGAVSVEYMVSDEFSVDNCIRRLLYS